MTTPSLLSTLRALEQAATKGPWECELRSVKQPHGEAARTLGSVRVKGAMPVNVVVRLDFGYGRDSDAATAALIAALRNAAPAILDALEAAEEVLCELRDRSEAKKALIDALAALDAGGE